MQAGADTGRPSGGEELHNILGRFQAWTGNKQGHGQRSAGAEDGVRELSYEEALQQLRRRRAGMAERKGPAAGAGVPERSVLAEEPGAEEAVAKPVLEKEVLEKEVLEKEKKPQRARVQPVRAAKAKPAATGKKVKAAAAVPAKKAGRSGAKPRAAAKRPREAGATEFRQVLAKAVREKPMAAPSQSAKGAERELRVSVRLTTAEERRLQQYAAQAGLTVSAYLRKKALEMEEAAETMPEMPREPEVRLGRTRLDGTRSDRTRSDRTGQDQVRLSGVKALTAGESAVPVPAALAKSGWGDWITLLRNRFLSSPVRFAERA